MLIAIEGIDGSGKGTQVERLRRSLVSEGITVGTMSFPQYTETIAGKMIGEYLNGDLGNVHPKIAAMLYSVDRFQSLPRLDALRKTNDVVLLDRWVGSNIAHQSARMWQMTSYDRGFLKDFIIDLEHGLFGLPILNMTILLHKSVSAAQENIQKKQQRAYTDKKADAHEEDMDHLYCAARMYDRLAEMQQWVVINTMEGESQISEYLVAEKLLCHVMSEIAKRKEISWEPLPANRASVIPLSIPPE